MSKKRRPVPREEAFPEAASAGGATGLMAAPAKSRQEWDSYLELQSLETETGEHTEDRGTDAL
ncbi:MAG: hypothetical protein K6G56_06145 [Clostridiales bacterium]|nr:hypothetical protein [Clostridiales bacterium]